MTEPGEGRVARPRPSPTYDVTLIPVRWEEPFGLVPPEWRMAGTASFSTRTRGRSARRGRARELAHDAALRRRLHANGVETAARFRDVDFDRTVERLLLEAAA